MNNTTTHGGPRKGSGRPKKLPTEKRKKVAITLSPEYYIATAGDRSGIIERALNLHFSPLKNEKMYFVATVSDTVHNNIIAWAVTESTHKTKGEAEDAAKELWRSIQEEFEKREDYGHGAIIGKSVVVHDGKEVLPI